MALALVAPNRLASSCGASRLSSQKTGLSRATIYRYTQRNLFPQKRRIGPNRVGWLAAEVIAWVATLPPPGDDRTAAPFDLPRNWGVQALTVRGQRNPTCGRSASFSH
jgi:predicted DNA-binding transcriptional regulator AlpA